MASAVVLFAASASAAKCPNVHIVLDASGSMSTSLPGGQSRWAVASDAVNKVLEKYDGKFPIGLSFFPGGGCDSSLASVPKYNSKAVIKAAITANGPHGSTPSAAAIQAAAMIKELRDPSREQYVLFITDGAPGCSTLDTCDGTINEITKARMQSPSITTFVVGFGGGLDATSKACLGRMADAGGKPDMTADRFYKADSADDLNKALSEIIKVVAGGGDVGMGSFCDDTCYSNGCPTPGDLCVAGECRPHPCAGVSCPKDQYCYTDGLTPGRCTKACTKACPDKTRCIMGGCATDPCIYACPAGLVCNPTARRCEADPLCGMMSPENSCKGTSACRGGACADNVCRFISCPKGTRCVPWEGTCEWVTPPANEMPMDEEPFDDSDPRGRGGCNTIPGAAESASLGVAAAYLLGLLVARRRRR